MLFIYRVAGIPPTSALSLAPANGAFADLLTGEAPIVLPRFRWILYLGDADQQLDFTTKDDVANYAADVALDTDAPRFLRIAGDVVSPRDLAILMTRLDRRRWKPFRAGGLTRLSALISIARALSPTTDEPFPAWQGMQYVRDMSSGRGKLSPLDNDRYGKTDWTRAEAVLAPTLRSHLWSPTASTAIGPFPIHFAHDDLDDLTDHLARTPWPDAGTVKDDSQGPLATTG